MEIRIGTRPSPLALAQAREAVEILKNMYPSATYNVNKILTTGDIDKTTPISEVEGTDFFTRQLDEALLEGRIDVAVHSAKDLPDPLPEGLEIAVETPSISRNDALVSNSGAGFFELPENSRIGASSLRRKEEIRILRKDLKIVDVRGDIIHRLSLIEAGLIDALVVAHAALMRLGLENRAAEILPLNLFETHPKQGSLSLVMRL